MLLTNTLDTNKRGGDHDFVSGGSSQKYLIFHMCNDIGSLLFIMQK